MPLNISFAYLLLYYGNKNEDTEDPHYNGRLFSTILPIKGICRYKESTHTAVL